MVTETGGASATILPGLVAETGRTCTAAAMSCGIAGTTAFATQAFSSAEGGGETDSETTSEGVKGYAPKDSTGKTIEPEKDATGHVKPLSEHEHSVLGTAKGRKVGEYKQAFEFGKNGEMKQRIDFTDHGRPKNHTNPHIHERVPNPTGGTPKWD